MLGSNFRIMKESPGYNLLGGDRGGGISGILSGGDCSGDLGGDRGGLGLESDSASLNSLGSGLGLSTGNGLDAVDRLRVAGRIVFMCSTATLGTSVSFLLLVGPGHEDMGICHVMPSHERREAPFA